jgi:hypothetical protein
MTMVTERPVANLTEARCPCGATFEDCRGCPPKSTLPPVPACQEMPDDGDDACPVCGYWSCRCGQ